MAKGFGTPYATSVDPKFKVTIVVSVAVVFVAILAVVLFLQNGSPLGDGEQKAQALTEQAPVVPAGDVDVLVAKMRIEEGAQLNPTMFDASKLEESKVPMGALRKRDIAQVNGKFAAKLLQPNVPILLSDINEQRPASLLSIPSGYRAVAIVVDNRSSVEGFAKPNTRVDVLFTYIDQGRQKVSTIVRFVKILSVGGLTAADADKAKAAATGSTITLLVSERDAKKIELARKIGELSLSLVGDQEDVNALAPTTEEISINDLLNNPATPTESSEEPESSSNVMYSTDPKTGRQIRYILTKQNKWVQDRSSAAVAAVEAK